MRRLILAITLLVVTLLSAGTAAGQPFSDSQLRRMERNITRTQQGFEDRRTDNDDIPPNHGWLLRSNHFVFGLPVLQDNRHDFNPNGTVTVPGISVLVREGFVVAHFDRMRTPLFVCQRWTTADYHRMRKTPSQLRPWAIDLELPVYTQVGNSYLFSVSRRQRGHMARHADNRAWGVDNSRMGVLMSNSVPQARNVNQGDAWRDLEDALQGIVADSSADIEAIWTISGSLYRDEENPPNEAPEVDFAATRFIGDGFGDPKATYKVVGWFDSNGHFQARGYVFEQDDQDTETLDHLTRIVDIEDRAGVNLFPMLRDAIERLIEEADYGSMWDD